MARSPRDPALAPAAIDGFAAVSVHRGIGWFGGFGALLAVIFGIISLRKAKRA